MPSGFEVAAVVGVVAFILGWLANGCLTTGLSEEARADGRRQAAQIYGLQVDRLRALNAALVERAQRAEQQVKELTG